MGGEGGREKKEARVVLFGLAWGVAVANFFSSSLLFTSLVLLRCDYGERGKEERPRVRCDGMMMMLLGCFKKGVSKQE